MILLACGRLHVNGREEYLVRAQVVGHAFRRHAGLRRGIAPRKGPGVGDEQHGLGVHAVPAQGIHGLLHAGEGVFVEGVGGRLTFLHLIEHALQRRALLHRGEIAHDARVVLGGRALFHVAAERHHGNGHLVLGGRLLESVVHRADDFAGLIDVGLHGLRGVDDEHDARGHAVGTLGLFLVGVLFGILLHAGIDAGHLKKLRAAVLELIVRGEHGQKIEVLLRHLPVLFHGLGGNHRQIRGLARAGRVEELHVLRHGVLDAVGRAQIHDGVVTAEEQHRLTPHLIGEHHGDGLRPFGGFGDLEPAVRTGGGHAYAQHVVLPGVHVIGSEGARIAHHLGGRGVAVELRPGMRHHALKHRGFAFLHERLLGLRKAGREKRQRAQHGCCNNMLHGKPTSCP